jgi:type 2 lantibiotic biosynthesis protein LanM
MPKTGASPGPWALGLNLRERLTLGKPAFPISELSSEAGQRAKRRLTEWRSQSPFGKKEFFARRLRRAALTEAAFRDLLGEDASSLAERAGEAPSWYREIESAFAAAPAGGRGRAPGWGRILDPLLDRSFRRLNQGLADILRRFPGAPFNTTLLRPQLTTAVTRQLEWMLGRAVVLEMRVAKLAGRLAGDTPGERFVRFVNDLARPERARSFLNEYPVLARTVVQTLELWLQSSLELLQRLAMDWDLIRGQLLTGDPGSLVEIVPGQGDRHRGGRSVCRLRFASGLLLVYKPRPLAIDLWFERFLRWIEVRGSVSQRAARVLDRGSYGWSEFMNTSTCQTREEMRCFFLRQGAFVALLHVLRAHDFHRENIVASGEHPVLIDLETLLGPDYGRGDPSTYSSRAAFELGSSVTRVMLLPYLQEGLRDEALEPSGLGGREGQRSLIRLPAWIEPGTDEMCLDRQHRPLPSTTNHPSLQGRPVDPRDFAEDVVEGFRSTYRVLLDAREELLAENSPLDELRDIEVRVIVRDTAVYSLILDESFHPDCLRNALDRDRLFDRLWFGMDMDPVVSSLELLLEHEVVDLWRGDIPHFTSRADSRDLWTSDGVRMPDFLARSGLEMVREGLRAMGEDDLRRQTYLVRASFAALTMSSDPERASCAPSGPPKDPTRQALLAAASAVADRLVELARRDGSKASWIGLRPLSRGWQLRALSIDLYSGLPGVAVALAHAARLLDREDLLSLSRGALETFREELRRVEDYWSSLGAYMGWGGALYTCLHLAILWQDERLLAEVESRVPRLGTLVEQDNSYDLVFGSAGCLAPLLELWRLRGSRTALEMACRMGDRLLVGARPQRAGIGWVTIEPEQPLTGFTHGGAGFAWALLELFRACGDDRFRLAAEQALAFESSVFVESARNWPDFRNGAGRDGQPARFAAMWCNGAGGIGLSRLRMMRTLSDSSLRQEAEVALETMLRHGFGDTHCLCHGDLGNLDVLLEAAGTLNGRWREALEKRKGQLLTSLDEHGWRCGVPRAFETPGLLEGLAGILYNLLRLADPAGVPSVLTLEFPAMGGNAAPRDCQGWSSSAAGQAQLG